MTVKSDLDLLREDMQMNFQRTWDKQDATNGRVKALESWRDRLVGALVVLVALGIPEAARELLSRGA